MVACRCSTDRIGSWVSLRARLFTANSAYWADSAPLAAPICSILGAQGHDGWSGRRHGWVTKKADGAYPRQTPSCANRGASCRAASAWCRWLRCAPVRAVWHISCEYGRSADLASPCLCYSAHSSVRSRHPIDLHRLRHTVEDQPHAHGGYEEPNDACRRVNPSWSYAVQDHVGIGEE